MTPNPPPFRSTRPTVAAQSTCTPSSRGRIGNVLPAAVKITGRFASRLARPSSSPRAAAGVIPPTSTPAILVPSASRPADPAKTTPITTAETTATDPAQRAKRRTCAQSSELKDEQLDAARDVELDARDVAREVAAEERDR